MSVRLIVHPQKRQRFHAPSLSDMKIGVFIPADNVQEEIAHKALRLWWELVRPERECQFIAAIHQDQSIVLFFDQFIYRAITCAPTGRRSSPGRSGVDTIVGGRKWSALAGSGERAEAAPAQVG